MQSIFNHFSKISLVLWLIAITQSALAITGVFSIVATTQERIIFGVVELATMLLVILNSFAIMLYIAKQNSPLAYQVSRLCLYSLLLCFAGDIVNRNFLQQFYQYDNIIKHSYLADSVIFFFPAYLVLIIAVTRLALSKGLSKRFIITTTLLATSIALYTYSEIHIAGSAIALTLITLSYSILVSILAITAIWLMKSLSWQQLPIRIWLAAIGLVLAMVADAIIGQFWIFGNQGQGYFPIVSHINWIIYLTSQVLIQQLPIGLLQAELRSNSA